MCSLGDDEQETEKYFPSIDATKLHISKTCNKCRQDEPCIVLRQKDAYCKTCFLAATTHKFKAFLGKNRLIYPNEKVMIAYKEGHECAALLHFIRSGLDLTTPKKLRFEAVVVNVEGNFHLSIDERTELLQAIELQCKEFGFDIKHVSLLKFIENPDGNLEEFNMNSNDLDQINQTLQLGKNKTQKLELLKIKERNLLYHVAQKLGCKHIFTPELGNHIAAQLMTSVSLGRGVHLPLDVGICDDRNKFVNIIRPLRQFDIKEIAMYNHFNNVRVVHLPRARNTTGSIQHLMRNFVSNLQTNFPATITTIVRTGDKLALDDSLANNKCCALCAAAIENPSSELSSAEATTFSKFVSNRSDNEVVDDEEKFVQMCNTARQDFCFACSLLQNF